MEGKCEPKMLPQEREYGIEALLRDGGAESEVLP